MDVFSLTAKRDGGISTISPEDVVMLVNLLAFLGPTQDPPVSHHGAADALGPVPSPLPVIKHQAVG